MASPARRSDCIIGIDVTTIAMAIGIITCATRRCHTRAPRAMSHACTTRPTSQPLAVKPCSECARSCARRLPEERRPEAKHDDPEAGEEPPVVGRAWARAGGRSASVGEMKSGAH